MRHSGDAWDRAVDDIRLAERPTLAQQAASCRFCSPRRRPICRSRWRRSMKRIVSTIALAAAMAVAATAALGPDAQHHQAARLRQLRRQGPGGLRPARRAGQLDRPRRRLLPRARGRDLQRSDQGQVLAAHRQGPLHRAAVRRHRRAVAQHDLDALARHLARPELHRRQLLRRPGLHRAQGPEGELGARAHRRLGLHPDRHDHRTQPRRLFPRQQDEAKTVTFATADEAVKAYDAGRCDAFTTDVPASTASA